MVVEVVVTRKFQVTIPKEVREAWVFELATG